MFFISAKVFSVLVSNMKFLNSAVSVEQVLYKPVIVRLHFNSWYFTITYNKVFQLSYQVILVESLKVLISGARKI